MAGRLFRLPHVVSGFGRAAGGTRQTGGHHRQPDHRREGDSQRGRGHRRGRRLQRRERARAADAAGALQGAHRARRLRHHGEHPRPAQPIQTGRRRGARLCRDREHAGRRHPRVSRRAQAA